MQNLQLQASTRNYQHKHIPLITIPQILGVCAPYEEAVTFEKSACFSPREDVEVDGFSQFIFDNSSTLDDSRIMQVERIRWPAEERMFLGFKVDIHQVCVETRILILQLRKFDQT